MRQLALFLFTVFTFLQLTAQPQRIEVYSIEDGLAQSQVYAVLADQQGYVWAATQGGGLSRFDGLSFTNFSTFDNLPGNYVNALCETAAGEIWIGTNKGACFFDGQNFWPQLSESGAVLSILEIEEKEELWVLCEKGLFCRKEGDWIQQDLPVEKRPTSLGQINGVLVLGTNVGVWKLLDNQWKNIREADGLRSNVLSLTNRNTNMLWAAALDRGLYRVYEDSMRSFPAPGRVVLATYQSKAKDFWIAIQSEGLFVKSANSNEWIQLKERNGLGSNTVRAITEDPWGTIWVGTSGGGLCAIREAPFQSFDQKQGLPARPVYALSGSDSLGLVFSVGQKGLLQQRDQLPQQWQLDSILGSVKIKTIAIDEAERIWLGTEGEGVLVHAAHGWEKVPEAGKHILHLLPKENGNIWISSAFEGLSKLAVLEDTLGLLMHLENFRSDPKLPKGRIESIHKDRSGRLILAYRKNGLAAWSPDSLYWHLGLAEGLPSRNIRAVREDTLGYLWAATANGLVQLALYESVPKIRIWSRQNGLQSNNLYCLEIDDSQNIWVGSEKGVEELEMSADRKIQTVTAFGKEEGFSGIETCTDAAFKDSKGDLWFGTMNGLMWYQKTKANVIDFPPPILQLEDIRIQYQSILADSAQQILSLKGEVLNALQLTHRQNHLSFRLQGLDQSRPKDIRYQWRLKGWEEEWNPPTDQQEPVFSNVAPGDYQFEARAVGEGGRLSESVFLTVHIEAPYWQKMQFRLMAALGIVGLLGLFFYAWLRRWKRKQKALEEGLRMQNQLLELEQKALQLQMNPHFISNAMQGIQHQLKEGHTTIANDYLYKFGALMRSVLLHSRKKSITLEDEIENLQHYLDLEQFRLGNRFTYQIHYEEDLEIALINVPPMLVQPFLENAIHHGLKGKIKGGKIDLFFEEVSEENIKVTIQDNGKGLDVSKTDKRAGHESTALKVITERLQFFQKERFQESTAEVFSVKNNIENEQICGVKVVLVLPVLEH